MSTSTMNGLVLVTTDNEYFYYCTVENGKFTDGDVNLETALSCEVDWEPAFMWRFTNLAASSLIKWSD